MNLVLDIATSMEFWRRVYPISRAPLNPVNALQGECAVSRRDVKPLIPHWITPEFLAPLDGKLHLLAFDLGQRRRTKGHVVHIWTGDIPRGSFYQLNESVFVAAPEFIFLVAAQFR